MDALFWAGNWQAVPESQYLKAPAALVRQQNWIIEGYIDETMAERLSFAELVIYLDYSGPRCAWRVFRRWLAHRTPAVRSFQTGPWRR